MSVVAKNISSYNELELKGYILSLIEKVKDRAQLLLFVEAANDILEVENDWWDELSPQQQLELDEALAECEDPTKLISHEEATKQINSWLKE
jgi:hypothetical protein